MRIAVAYRTFRCSGRISATFPLPPILLVWRYALRTLGLGLKERRSFLLPPRRLYSAHEWFGSSAPTTFMPLLTSWICYGHMSERIKTSPVRTIWERGIYAVHTPTLSPTPVLGDMDLTVRLVPNLGPPSPQGDQSMRLPVGCRPRPTPGWSFRGGSLPPSREAFAILTRT
jgi:hypothetical protein